MKPIFIKFVAIFGVLAGSLFVSAPAKAEASIMFNTLSNDLDTVLVSNYTDCPNSSTCWSNSVSAQPGDIIAVRVYYHNTGTQAAPNTRIRMSPQNSGNSTNHTFSGSVTSVGSSNTASGSASVNISSSESLTFIPGSMKWYPDQQVYNSTPVPYGQSENLLFNGTGINIGYIGPDSTVNPWSFSAQGNLVARFQVSSESAPIDECVIDYFHASPSTISEGSFSTLSWATTGCDYVRIPAINSNQLPNDSSVGTPLLYSDKTYTLYAYGANTVTDTVTVNVNPDQTFDECTIDLFDADPSTVDYGDNTELSWETTDCDYVKISGISGTFSDDDTYQTNDLYSDKTYTLTAYGFNGDTDTDTVHVNVRDQNDNECVIDDFYASDTYIDYGDSTTLRWETTDCDDVELHPEPNNFDNNDVDGSISTGKKYSSTTYTLTATGDNGSDEKSVTVHVRDDSDNDESACSNGYDDDGDGYVDMQDPGCSSSSDDSEYNTVVSSVSVTTLGATSVGQTSAQVNGVYVTSGTGSQVWFQYGLTPSLGSATALQGTGYGSSAFSAPIYGLTPSTTYYFRAAGQTANGVVYGSILTFRTLAATVVPVVVPTTVVSGTGTASLLTLEIDTRFETVAVNDVLSYTVTYRNISRVDVHDAILHIQFPKEVQFVRASRGDYSAPDNTLTVVLGTVRHGEEGKIFIDGKVATLAKDKDVLVTSATLAYATPSNAQEEVIAYEINKVSRTSSNLLGFALGAGWPTTLLGWLFFLFILLVLIVLAMKLFGRNSYPRSDRLVPPRPM